MLTTSSKNSSLTQVSQLIDGSIGRGFGGAVLQTLLVTGQTKMEESVQLGTDLARHTLTITARIKNERLMFDANDDGSGMDIIIPDPAAYGGEARLPISPHRPLRSILRQSRYYTHPVFEKRER